MDATTATILGTLIGALAAISSAVLAGLFSVRNERLRLIEAKRSADIAALRKAAGVAFEEIFAVQHAMNWITWYATNSPSEIDDANVREYEEQIHRAYPRLLGALAKVASLDLNLYHELHLICERIYHLEENVALAVRDSATTSTGTTFQVLAQQMATVRGLERDLPPEMARIMHAAEGR